MPPSLDRFRTALKFSLWTWALYWPGGGLLLLLGGLDPIGIVVTFASLLAFVLMLASGALRATSSRNLRQFLLERPLYFVGLLVVLVGVAAVVPSIEGFGLLLFAGFWFGGLVYATVLLLRHLRETGQGVLQSRADQLLLVFGLVAFFSLLVFLDALLPMASDGTTTGSPAALVAVGTWMNLLYPGMVLVASRPFREPMRNPLRRARPDPMVVPAPPVAQAAAVPAVAAAAPSAPRRRKDRFRAS